MLQLIEMLAEKSPLAAFFFGNLSSVSYPAYLVWGSEEPLTFCLKCTRKNKKGWTPEVERIFLDYIIFTHNKSKADDQGKRTVLLQAMKKSAYIKIDDQKSTADEKFCRFTKKFEKLLSRCMQTISEEADTVPEEGGAALPEPNGTIPAEDSQMSLYTEDGHTSSGQCSPPLTPTSGSNPSETSEGPVANGESLLTFPSDYDPLEDFVPFLNSLNHNYEAQSPLCENFDVQSIPNVGWNMQGKSQEADTVPMEVGAALPETTSAEDNQLSLYAKDDRSTSSQCCSLSTPNAGGHPSETTSGESLVSFSPDYNPLDLSTCAQSSAHLTFDIHTVAIVGDRVNILDRVTPDSPLPRSEYFLLTLTATDK